MGITQHPQNKGKFSSQFLVDFNLIDVNGAGRSTLSPSTRYKWVYHKKALERFHIPICYRRMVDNDSEGEDHFRLKQLTHNYIYENFYMNNDCKILVTTELEQMNNPFTSHLESDKEIIYYTLDVCAIRTKDNQVFDFEIDGKEHYTKIGMMKGRIRDAWLKDRYGAITLRIDKEEKEPPYKKINDLLIHAPTVQRVQNDKFAPRRKKDFF